MGYKRKLKGHSWRKEGNSMFKKKLFPSIFLIFVLTYPVFAVSYVDLERTTLGELDIDYGYALELDGTNDYVNINHDASLNFTTKIMAMVLFLTDLSSILMTKN